MFPLIAAAVFLTWDASVEPEVVLYRLYTGIQSLQAGNPPLVGYSIDRKQFELTRKFEVTGLDYGTTYFFCVTAIDSTGLESGYSNELQYLVPLPTPEPTPTPLPTPQPTPTPTPEPTPTPTPEPTPDHPGKAWGWWK